MRIVIAGSGDTGTHLAKMLSAEKQDITLMSNDRAYLSTLDSSYNFMVAVGDPTSRADLRTVDIDKADLFISVTPQETVNIVSASLARHLGARGCVARVSKNEYLEPELAEYFRHLGIDTLVYPEALVAEEIKTYIRRNWVTCWFPVCGGQLILAGVRIRPDAPVAGRQLKDLSEFRNSIHVSAIRRNRRVIIPRGDDSLNRYDIAFFLFRPENEAEVARLTGHRTERVRDLMIAGAGPITRMLASKLGPEYTLTVVDPDAQACRSFASDFPRAAVVNTSPRDIETLQGEGLSNMDMFLALGPDGEANMVSCMMAREMGVRSTVAEIEDMQYMGEAERLWIGKVVNKKLITSGTIVRQILGSGLRVESSLSLPDAGVAEIEVRPNSRITRAPVRELGLPAGLTLGGLTRNGKAFLVDGNTRIQDYDKVMVFFMPGALQQVMKVFHK